MSNTEKKLIGLLLIIFIIITIILSFKLKNKDDIKLSQVKITNEAILSLDNNDKKKCIDGLIKYLNKKKYYVCKKIVFYKNTYSNSSVYLYALVIGNDKSLIEITNLGNSKFNYRYIGNELTPNDKSSKTGVSYNQIVNKEEYEKEINLEKLREEIKNSQPEDDEVS